MSSENLDPVRANVKGLCLVLCTFYPNNTSDPAAASTVGDVTVTRTAAGTFKIEFNRRFSHFFGLVQSPSLGTGADITVQAGTFTAGSGTTLDSLVLRTMVGAVATDFGPGADDFVTVLLLMGEQEDYK